MFKDGALSFSRKELGVFFDRFIGLAFLVVNVMSLICSGLDFDSCGRTGDVGIFNIESVENLVFAPNPLGDIIIICNNNIDDRRSGDLCLGLLGVLRDFNVREN